MANGVPHAAGEAFGTSTAAAAAGAIRSRAIPARVLDDVLDELRLRRGRASATTAWC